MGRDTMERLARRRVILFGVGGVGSWCAEALVRSGVGNLAIVDGDSVCESNINRQLMATTTTIGKPKVEVMRQRLLDINPDAEITARKMLFNGETADHFHFDDYDYVIDAIDSLPDKMLLILMAARSRATLFSSMGAALKTDPSRIRVTEFWKVEGDPLARVLRKRFKAAGEFPEKKFQCVYSDEPPMPQKSTGTTCLPTADGMQRTHENGSLVHVTAVFGLTLASLVVRDQA